MSHQRHTVRQALVNMGQLGADEMADFFTGNDKPRPDIKYKIEKFAEEWIECLYNTTPLEINNQIPNIEGDELQKATEEGYEKGYSRGLEVGELQDEEAVQKACQDWLREEIVRLEGMKYPNVTSDRDEVSFYSAMAVNTTLQTIIDRYLSELNQEHNIDTNPDVTPE